MQGRVPVTDSSEADCARLLGGLPQVPHSADDFQQYLQQGSVALTPSFHSRLIDEWPSFQNLAIGAASEGSTLAWSMNSLVRHYNSAAGMHATYI